MPTRPLGRAPRTHDPAIPHLTTLLAGQQLPPPPVSLDWTRGMPSELGMMLNDTLNCCSSAAFYHAMQVWSFNASGTLDTEPDSNVEALYCAISGYQPSAAPPGPPCNEQQVLSHLHKVGAPVGADGKRINKLAAFFEVDVGNLDDIKRTIAACGIAYIGIKVPQYIDPPPPVWDVQSGNDTLIGGHALILAGYDAAGAKVISWGQYYTMTWAFFSKYADEAYALADPAWIAAKGTTPGGLDLPALEKQIQALKDTTN